MSGEEGNILSEFRCLWAKGWRVRYVGREGGTARESRSFRVGDDECRTVEELGEGKGNRGKSWHNTNNIHG